MIFGLDFVDQSIQPFPDLFWGPIPGQTPLAVEAPQQSGGEKAGLLPTWTSIPPNVPRSKPRSLPRVPNLLTCNPFIIPIVPLPYILRHCHLRIRAFWLRLLSRFLPWIRIMAAQLEKFERLLRSGSRTHISERTQQPNRSEASLACWGGYVLFTCAQVDSERSTDHSPPMLDPSLALASPRWRSRGYLTSPCACPRGTTPSRRVGQ